MKALKLLPAIGLLGVLGGCAVQPKPVAQLDAKINEVTADDFGQFMYHETLAEENLEDARRIRQWWKDGHYWNIDNEKVALAAGERALQHRQMAEKHLVGWHDRCVRHPDDCVAEETLATAYFDTGSATPRALKHDVIKHIVELSQNKHPVYVEVIGYTDTVGSEKSNKGLAERRAQHVHQLLHSHGVWAETVVKNIPYGEAGGPDNTPNQDYRRVDIKIRLHQPYPK